MDKAAVIKQTQNIQREGFLEKQSRFLKSWRQRWVVLTSNFIFTFKERREYHNPTEIISLKEIISIKAAEQELQQKNSIKIESNDTTFYFSADSPIEKEAWIGAIGKAMVKTSRTRFDE